jgi:hypothetical protein
MICGEEMKEDERRLMDELQKRIAKGEQPYVRAIVRELGIHEKRAAYICEKWTRKHWYEYGVSVLAGWLTTDGLNA